MVYDLSTATDLAEFIENNRNGKLVIEFKASWCQGSYVMKTHFQKFAVRYGQGNLKFATVDVDHAGLDNLNKARADLNLGAIPVFYVYENNNLIEMLVTCSYTKLEGLLQSHYIGNVIDDEDKEPKLIKVVTEVSKIVKDPKKLDESPTRRPSQLERRTSIKTAQPDRRISYDSRFPQIDLKAGGSLARRVSAVERSASPNMLMKFRNKFLKRNPSNINDSEEINVPLNRRFSEMSPTRMPTQMQRRMSSIVKQPLPPQQERNNASVDQTNSTNKYPDRGLSPDMQALLKAKNRFLRIKATNQTDLDNIIKPPQTERNNNNISYDLANLKVNTNRRTSHDLNLDKRMPSELVLKAKTKFLNARNERV